MSGTPVTPEPALGLGLQPALSLSDFRRCLLIMRSIPSCRMRAIFCLLDTFPPTGMPTFTGDPDQPIYCTAGNLMDLMQMMLQNQQAAAEAAQRLATPTPRSDSLRDELREYQKEVKYAPDTKSVTTFDGTNYEAWRVGILADAEVIGGTDILLKNQRESPAT
ncbi:hypothetical protein ACJ73_09051 [Blastomyces percursus]|uniref:Uncharacterized protein n=1 Tax=Blastomyces percursus TaxID=1658174 RepID=A0A1J9PDM5_9EURO|nr:hypothetical protein ACJ73_09051 [Blastomyces percursus]